jgi:hypothetical protein
MNDLSNYYFQDAEIKIKFMIISDSFETNTEVLK